MCPYLNDITVIKHDHTVSIVNGGEAVGDDQRSSPFKELLQSVLDEYLGLCVNVGRGLIKDEDTWVG